MQHWFVAATGEGEDERVGVFRGLDVSIVGWDLYRLDETTSLPVGDLTPDVRSRVRGGITADDAQDADRILETLRDGRLPVCTEIELFPDGAASGSTSSSAAPSSSGRPARSATPTGAAATRTASPSSATPSATPSTAPSTSPSASPSTTLSGEPGVDCREEGS